MKPSKRNPALLRYQQRYETRLSPSRYALKRLRRRMRWEKESGINLYPGDKVRFTYYATVRSPHITGYERGVVTGFDLGQTCALVSWDGKEPTRARLGIIEKA